jgi:hypothetical protein
MPGEGMDVEPPMTAAEAQKKRCPRFTIVAEGREGPPLAGFGTTLPEARTLVTHVALTGVVYPLASVMPELPLERTRLLQMTLPTMPILPVDLFSRGTDMEWDRFKSTRPDIYLHNYPEILDLKVNAQPGVYDVVGLTNWRSAMESRELHFAEKLGLNSNSSYIAFDFWNQKFLGVFKDRMTLEIAPHDTRVLLLHPLLGRPQLIGTSRHISGSYSILELAWNATKNQLHGKSETVPGDTYRLFFHVPAGFQVAQVRASTPGGHDIAAHFEQTGNALEISIPGQSEAVDWQVLFTVQGGQPSKKAAEEL